MKRYKLKKDLPTFKAGDEFYTDSNNNLRLSGPEIVAYSHITLGKFPNILKDWFEEIPNYKRWRARQGNTYWFINDGGDEEYEMETGHEFDDFRWMSSNYFENKKEAKAYKKYLFARQVLLDDAEGGKWLKNDENLAVFHTDSDIDEWIRTSAESYLPGVIYFKTKASLRKSLEEHREQWRTVLEYETKEM